MSQFVVETTYRLPMYRQRSYEAETLEAACELAVADENWEGAEGDAETIGENYITGAWAGCNPDWDDPLPIPPRFDEWIQRKSDFFEVLLGLLKAVPPPSDAEPLDGASWRDRVAAAVNEAEAILLD